MICWEYEKTRKLPWRVQIQLSEFICLKTESMFKDEAEDLIWEMSYNPDCAFARMRITKNKGLRDTIRNELVYWFRNTFYEWSYNGNVKELSKKGKAIQILIKVFSNDGYAVQKIIEKCEDAIKQCPEEIYRYLKELKKGHARSETIFVLLEKLGFYSIDEQIYLSQYINSISDYLEKRINEHIEKVGKEEFQTGDELTEELKQIVIDRRSFIKQIFLVGDGEEQEKIEWMAHNLSEIRWLIERIDCVTEILELIDEGKLEPYIQQIIDKKERIKQVHKILDFY